MQMQMSADSAVCLWEENFNVYPMQMRFIIKQNVQGLLRAGREAAALDAALECGGTQPEARATCNPEQTPAERARQNPTP